MAEINEPAQPKPPGRKRVWRSGVRFDCPDCGKLWRDDDEHAEHHREPCPDCGGELRMVGRGEAIVQFAKWFRCRDCGHLYMWRRGELASTGPRSGFNEFA
jgi:predicted RNA-binding Zn-ribbon protein involved in translation (DUF1610 family)